MASNSRRARRAKSKVNMTLEQIVADLNSAIGQLDNFAQQAAADETTNRAVVARLTQGVVLAGTAIEILGGLVQAEKMAEAAAAATTEDSTDE
jgi:hypothetical protein